MQRYGKFEEAIPLIKMGMRLHGPYFPAIYLAGLGRSQFQLGRYEEALATYKALLERSLKGQWPKYIAHLTLAANYVGLGRMADAREHADEVLRLNPKFSLEVVRKRSLYKDPDHLEKWLDAYRKAGLPETPPLTLPDKPSIAVLTFTNMSV